MNPPHAPPERYARQAADVRMAFFADHGFPPTEFRRLAMGPVVRKDELEYFREIDLHETVTVTHAALAMSPDAARFAPLADVMRLLPRASAFVELPPP